VHVGGDLFTQNVVEEEIGQMRKEGIVREEYSHIRRDITEGVVVGSEHGEGTWRVEDSIKPSTTAAPRESKETESRHTNRVGSVGSGPS
jgi:hypothetical protein